MGTEVWALIALVLVLTVYLLPVLVGRRELLGHARTQDRYSGQLRLLATINSGGEDEACVEGGHAQIFRRPPEVRAMNRPAVRHVRAVRTERELERARRAHEAGRAARARAASRRLIVACALLGVLVGVALVAAITVLPWWPVLIPTALLAGSMAAGRHAAVQAEAADRREKRRISELESTLARLTGAEPASAVGQLLHDKQVQVAAEPAASNSESRSIEAAAPVAEVAAQATAEESRADAVETSQPAAAAAEESVEAATKTPVTASASADVVANAPAGAEREAQVSETELSKSAPVNTPAQGWRPVQVPAPTYTLVASARGRKISELEDLEGTSQASAPVPARPTAARPHVSAPATPAVHPIDLDEVLARRRAAGE